MAYRIEVNHFFSSPSTDAQIVPDLEKCGEYLSLFGNKIVLLQVVNVPHNISNPTSHPMEIASSKSAPVLIVDDEKDIRYLLNAILQQKQIRTCLAGSLAEAQKFIENDAPVLIFLDNHLPDGFGLDHISQLKKKLPRSKIVMITAHDNPAEREKAYREGADYFISKPFTKDVIYKTIRELGGEFTVE